MYRRGEAVVRRNVSKRVGTWSGGYIRKTKSGRRVYVVERWAKGKRVHFSTGCSTAQGAERELRRWEADPLGYVPSVAAEVFELDSGLALAYRAHQLEAGLTREWVDEVTRCLADWREALAGRDLRHLRLADLTDALDKWPSRRPHRIKAIKGIYRWLRQKGKVDRNQDATLDLKLPPVRPEKLERRKVVPVEDVAAVLRHLPATSRDILHLLSATGWHVSEVRKFSEGGEIVRPMKADGVLAVLITRHKSGELTKTPILYPEHLAAAQRIRQLKSFPKRMTIARHMIKACEAAGVPWFGMGQMRHSVLTWGVEDGGVSVKQVSEFAHHKSEATTRKFYVDLRIPKDSIPVHRIADDIEGG